MMPDTDGQEYARAELKRRIEESQLGITRFSRERLIRDPSTVHRYVNGTMPIPNIIIEWLQGSWRYRGSK